MSKPTTLRTSIEKVSIESLISPQFRAGAEPGTGTPDAVGPTGVAPAGASPAGPSEESPEAPSGSPSHPFVPPLSGDPEFNVNPAPAAPRRPGPQTGAGPGVRTPGARPLGKVVPLPLPPGARRPEPDEESGPEAPPPPTMSEPSGPSPMPAPSAPPGAEDMARATEDFLRSSPVLGATGRKVQRHYPDPGSEGFHDPDAIAVISMVEELSLMGVPANRHSETRARLVALAARMERGDLEWTLLRKAVWFAMEYPELARRLMPVLLTWFDRAA